ELQHLHLVCIGESGSRLSGGLPGPSQAIFGLAGAALLQALFETGKYVQVIEVGPAIFARTVEFGQARYIGAIVGSPLGRALLALGRVSEAIET
ncbi:hypothetical protein ACC671_35775, partial [Rhizobium ruizarguesonis]